jgi:hypothetical protein
MSKYIPIFLILLFCAGCAEKTPYDVVYVTGTVLLDGEPVDGVSVTFSPVDHNEGHAAGGVTNAQGVFKLTTGGVAIDRGAEPGTYHVSLSKVKGVDKTFPEEDAGLVFTVLEDQLPMKYKSPQTSGIEPVTVVKNGKNEFRFELSTKE